jgi:hypothetical protein
MYGFIIKLTKWRMVRRASHTDSMVEILKECKVLVRKQERRLRFR